MKFLACFALLAAAIVTGDCRRPLLAQDDCVDCTTFMTDTQKRFTDPAQQQQVTDLVVNQACPVLQSIFPDCASYAQQYLPIAFSLFESLSATSICQTIGWCSSSKSRDPAVVMSRLAKLLHKPASKASDDVRPRVGDQCSSCQTFIADAQKRYTDPSQQQIIIDLVVNQACPLVASVFPDCAQYAQEYIPLGFQYLQSYSAQQICQLGGWCTSEKSPVLTQMYGLFAASKLNVAAAVDTKVGDTCSDCTKFVPEAQKFYSDPNNVEQIVDLVSGSLCPLLSGVFPECQTFAQSEIPALFNTLVSTDPTTICLYLHMCLESMHASLFRSHSLKTSSQVHRFEMDTPKRSNDEQCDDCQTFMADLQKYYADPSHQQNVIDEIVNEVCPMVSSSFPECAQLVPQYLPFAFQAFESLSPAFACAQLHFCSSTAKGDSILSNLLSLIMHHDKLSSQMCTDCNIVASLLRVMLKNDATVQWITEQVSRICNLVAPAGQDGCNAFAKTAIQELVYVFHQATNEQVCATFFPECASKSA